MRDFFGFKLSEVAVTVVLLVAVIPLVRATAAFNFLPLIFGFITCMALCYVKTSRPIKMLVPLLVALFFVPAPYRGQRLWENFENDNKEDDNSYKPVDKEEKYENLPKEDDEEEVEEKKDAKDTKDAKDEKEAFSTTGAGGKIPEPMDLKDLGEKLLSMEGGGKYRLPSEDQDGKHHIDSSTTFMNAYKQLKPDQVNALTADTQKLIAVQKDLMANLNNLKPLIADGKDIMKTFKNFFGSEPSST
jgi:hypothetical protein